MYSLSQAAKATGKGKSTIFRDLKNGKISGIRTGADGWKGGWQIDPAELHRVYPLVEPVTNVPQHATWDKVERPKPLKELDSMRERLAERDETIADLRTRLDRSEEERRETQAKLTALLSPPPRKWWKRLF